MRPERSTDSSNTRSVCAPAGPCGACANEAPSANGGGTTCQGMPRHARAPWGGGCDAACCMQRRSERARAICGRDQQASSGRACVLGTRSATLQARSPGAGGAASGTPNSAKKATTLSRNAPAQQRRRSTLASNGGESGSACSGTKAAVRRAGAARSARTGVDDVARQPRRRRHGSAAASARDVSTTIGTRAATASASACGEAQRRSCTRQRRLRAAAWAAWGLGQRGGCSAAAPGRMDHMPCRWRRPQPRWERRRRCRRSRRRRALRAREQRASRRRAVPPYCAAGCHPRRWRAAGALRAPRGEAQPRTAPHRLARALDGTATVAAASALCP